MKSINLIKNLGTLTFKNANEVYNVLQERLDWMDEREPEFDGAVHDEWEDKRSELEAICDDIENAIGENDEDLFFDAIDLLQDYQMIYGGLSRLKIMIQAA